MFCYARLMNKRLAFVFAAALSARFASAQVSGPAGEPRIDYIGGLTLCADNPQALARWYTEKFGLKIDNEYQGIYYGTVKMNGGDLNMGIHPTSADCRKAAKGFTITFHVDSYPGYLAKLKSRGLEPYKTEDSGPYGTFAYFSDLEGNTVAIWGS